jgi:enediyne biosynthesis protein E5
MAGTAGTLATRVRALRDQLRHDPRYLSAGFLTLILLVGQASLGFLESLEQFAAAVAFSMATEAVLGRLYRGAWPNLISSYMTGVSIGILVRSPYLWPYAVGSMLAIAQKYAIQFRGRHLFNPSNFGLSLLLLAAPAAVAGLGKQWTNMPMVMVVVFFVGFMVAARLRRLDLVLTYTLAYAFLSWYRSESIGVPLFAEWGQAFGPAFQLFIFFMITDPKTSPATRSGRVAYALTIAVLEHGFKLLRNQNAPFFALFLTSPLAILANGWLQDAKRNRVWWLRRAHQLGLSGTVRSASRIAQRVRGIPVRV